MSGRAAAGRPVQGLQLRQAALAVVAAWLLWFTLLWYLCGDLVNELLRSLARAMAFRLGALPSTKTATRRLDLP